MQRNGDRFTREYDVPDTVLAMIRGTLRINTTDAANPTYVLAAQEMDFTRAYSLDYKIVRNIRFMPLRLEAVERVTDRGGRTTERPVEANVRIRMRVGDAYVNVAGANTAAFTAGIANIYLPADPVTIP